MFQREEIPYDFELDKISEYINKHNSKRVLIQLPDGLKKYSIYILNELRKRIRSDVEIVFSGDSAWGSCMLLDQDAKREGFDLLIHIGHIEYPYYRSSYNTLFIPAYSLLDIGSEAIDQAIKILKSYDAKKISIFSTIQHMKLLPKIERELSKYFEIISSKKGFLVMGCEYSAVYPVLKSVDALVIVSGGVFHGIGMGLLGDVKPVIKIDPYENRSIDLTHEINKIRRIRYYKMLQALESRNWVIIDGVRGQRRDWYRRYLAELIRRNGGDYIVYIAENINKDLILNIDSDWVDAYVVLACPRIPIDDLSDMPKPVLTPGEARIVLTKKIDNYSFPW